MGKTDHSSLGHRRAVLNERCMGPWVPWVPWVLRVQPPPAASPGPYAAHAAPAQQEMSLPRSELFSKFQKFSSKISSQLQC